MERWNEGDKLAEERGQHSKRKIIRDCSEGDQVMSVRHQSAFIDIKDDRRSASKISPSSAV